MHAMTTTNDRLVRGFWKACVGALAGAALLTAAPTPAAAQVTVTGGVDFPTLYYFRGARQEVDPKFTMQPFVDVGGSIFAGEGALKSASLNVGSWNSIHTGSNEDAFDGAFYESDFYATLGLGFNGFTLGTTYTAYMYPAAGSDVFPTIHEIAFKGTVANKFAPYGLIAIEVEDGTDNPGTYLELGVGPSFPLTDADEGAPTLTIPVRVAFDLNDYYALDGDKFAYFGIGATVVIPRGKWSIKLAADVLSLSETLEAFNFDGDDTSKVGFVGLAGLGFAF